MTKVNPFAQALVRLQVPAHMGKSISARGFNVEADADGCVEVPAEIAAELKAHGLTDYVAPEKAAHAKK
jgi:hypothetical protein